MLGTNIHIEVSGKATFSRWERFVGMPLEFLDGFHCAASILQPNQPYTVTIQVGIPEESAK